MSRADRWKSDSQANADALARRGRTYADQNAASIELRWGRASQPKSLKQMAREVRMAYSDGMTDRLHDHDVGDGDLSGAPRYSAAFAQRLYGSIEDVDRGDPTYAEGQVVGYLVRAFDAALAKTAIADEHRIVWSIALGAEPDAATEAVGVPAWCSRLVAHDVLRRFLTCLSAIRVDLAKTETQVA